MGWPLSQDYNEAIQSPAESFADPELRQGEAVANALGIPMPRSGNFADVYEVRCPNGERWAIKCFTREVPGLRDRYLEISRWLQQVRLPFTVEFTYQEQGIRIRGAWYPILKMEWVEGLTLNDFVRQHLDKPAMLGGLLQIWTRMGSGLRKAGIAHADLQHGNVLLVPGSTASSVAVKLIDYDGMYVPSLAGKKSGEVGHPSYQHPQRLREGTFGPEVDRFPLLLIATSLRCLEAGGPALWQRHDNGDNLLFRETDLAAPRASAVFRELKTLPDAGSRTLVDLVCKALEGRLDDAPLLDEVLPTLKPLAPAVVVPALPALRPVESPVTPLPKATSPAPKAHAVATAIIDEPAPVYDDEAEPEEEEPTRRMRRPRRPRKRRKKGGGLGWLVAAAGLAGVVLIVGAVAIGAFVLLGRDPARAASLLPGAPAIGGGDKPGQPADPTRKLEKASLRLVASVPLPNTDRTTALSVSQDGSRAVTTGVNGFCATWTLGNPPKSNAPADPRLSRANFAAISPDGKHLLSASPGIGPLTLFNLDTLAEEATFKQTDNVGYLDVSFSPDGNSVVALTNGPSIRIWHLAAKKETRCQGSGKAAFRQVRFLADSRRVLALDDGGVFQLWDGETGEELRSVAFPVLAVSSFEVAPDGKRFAAVGKDRRIHVVDINTGRELYATTAMPDGEQYAAISSEGLLVANSRNASRFNMWFWDVASGQELGRVEGADYAGAFLTFSGDGRTLVGTWPGNSGWELRVWQVNTKP